MNRIPHTHIINEYQNNQNKRGEDPGTDNYLNEINNGPNNNNNNNESRSSLLVYRKFRVQMSTCRPIILTEVCRDVPQSLKPNTGIVL